MAISKTKVITGKNTRLSYFHGWEPTSINGGAEKYSVSVLIPKDDKETVDAINAAIDAAIEEGIAKFGGKKPNKAAIKLPLRDGDVERDDEAYKGHYFLNANSQTAPQIVDKAVKPILDRDEVSLHPALQETAPIPLPRDSMTEASLPRRAVSGMAVPSTGFLPMRSTREM